MVTVAEPKRSSGFGAKLREHRLAAGLTQTELGELIGMDKVAVSRIEAGHVQPTWPTVQKFCKALGKRPNDFDTPEEFEIDNPPPDPISKRK